ncbi:MAG: glycosyltransferase [Planctomycetia bacterium]|nr:glycosyltransferase [Planctomycetia bacterium]
MKVLLLGKGNIPERFSLVSINCENWISRNMEGHEIMTFGYNEGVDVQIQVDDDFGKVIDKLPHAWIPDVCVLWEVDWNLLPKGVENAPFPIVAIAWDWDYDIPFAKGIFESTDFTIALADFEKDAIRAIGAANVEVFYIIGVMKEYFSSNPRKIKDRKYDILYTTWIDEANYPDRSQWILNLCELSDNFNVCIANPSLDYADYNALLADSKLVLSHHRYGSMSGRVLEAGSQGTVVVETGIEVKKYFSPDYEYIPVTPNNFKEQVTKYLHDEQTLQDMSDRAYAKVTNNFEARNRFLGMLEFIEEQLRCKTFTRKLQTLSENERCIRRGEIYFYAHYRTKNYIPNDNIKLLALSINEFRKAVNIEPSPRAMTNLAVAKMAYGFLDTREENINDMIRDVIGIFEEIISTHPTYVMAHFNLGLLHMRVRNYSKALTVFVTTLKLLEDGNNYIDPWCLHNRDLDLFNKLLRRPLNLNLLLLCKGEEAKAIENTRKLYQSATHFFISLIEEENGHIFKVHEALLEASNLCPESGLFAMNSAKRLYLFGYNEESLSMYQKAIGLYPLHIDLRIEFIMHLYSYRMHDKAMREIKNALKIARAIPSLKGYMSALNMLAENYSASHYSYNLCKEKLLNSSIKLLYNYLRKDPHNLNVISRIVEIWSELGRTDKIFKIVEDYISTCGNNETIDSTNVSQVTDIYEILQQTCNMRSIILHEKLNRIKGIVDTLQK